METLQLLGTALGFGELAGINLYLTVFATGLAIQQGWIVLAPQYGKLLILGDPTIVFIAGALYFVEFFADKIPWVDSLWDALHTIIRPIGGALLGVRILGAAAPGFDIVVALLTGGISLTAHGVKAGARLVVNASPEPFSNIALSLTEDLTVLGGLALIHFHPVIALGVVTAFLGGVLYFGPRIARAATVRIWLAWRKFTSGPDDPKLDAAELPKTLPADVDLLLQMLEHGKGPIEWAVPCICAGSKRIRANVSGFLTALQGDSERLYFLSKGRLQKATEVIDLTGYKAGHESRFLSENLLLYGAERRPAKRTFVFERAKRRWVLRLTELVNTRIGQSTVVEGQQQVANPESQSPEV